MGPAVFAVAVAGLCDHAVPRLLGWFSAGGIVITAVLTATDLVAPNWIVVTVWLLVTSGTLLARGGSVHSPREPIGIRPRA
jgi:hypothetical protein